jgi:hypothetical protein
MRFVVLLLTIACTHVAPETPPVVNASLCEQGVPGLNRACVGAFAVSGGIVDGAYTTTVFSQGHGGKATRGAQGTLAAGDCSAPPAGMSAETCDELAAAVCSPPVLTKALEQSGHHESVATAECHGGWAVATSPSGDRVFRFLKGAWHAVPQAGASCHDWFLSAAVPIDACEAYHARQATLTAAR